MSTMIGNWEFGNPAAIWRGPNYKRTHETLSLAARRRRTGLPKKPRKIAAAIWDCEDYNDPQLTPEQIQTVKEILGRLGE